MLNVHYLLDTLNSPIYLSNFFCVPLEAPDVLRAQHPQRKDLIKTRQYRLNRRGDVKPKITLEETKMKRGEMI